MSRLVSICVGAAVAGLLGIQVLAAHAAVVESTATGFAVQQMLHIAAPPERVYAALTQPAKWWNSEHTFSGSAANLTLDARAGGCFCEIWDGGSVQHLIVADAQPGKILRLRGALGPFQGQGVDGALTYTLKASAGGTDLVLDNIMGGFMAGGLAKWPLLADAMLADQMVRLKRFLETGSPDSPK
ncbi:MAG TPA: SRPBCC domain-containing protein [Rhizomicrobium sp.]|jgi:uncharacterized protein YndB with AHSA1/START domain